MMAPEPLRSAMAVGGAEDTSLALPSDHKLRTGQQRVLDQVHTIKRGKSLHGRTSSPSPSPTSVTPQTTSEFGSFRFSPSKTNGTFSRNSSTISTGYNKVMTAQKSRTLSARHMGGRHFSTSGTLEQQMNASKWAHSHNGLKTSRSDPALVPPFPPAPAPTMRTKGQTIQSQQTIQTRINRQSTHSMSNGTQMTNSQTRMVRPPSGQFATDGKMGTMKTSKTELQQSGNNSFDISDLTVKRAVEFLSHHDNSFKHCGATFIQHATYKEEDAKQEVYQLKGIPTLVTLLGSSNPDVCQAAAGALRNLAFKNRDVKLEVQHYEGICKALQLLKETDSTETQKQITGLLWNLSSADELKRELTMTALPVLTKNVVVPFTTWAENIPSNNIHPDVFYNATGCLRNLSCSKESERKAMRECPGLIDSLLSYIQSCVAEENPDDTSVENCTCILHNLTYKLQAESPECFKKFVPEASESQNQNKSPTIGCFSPKSSKVKKQSLFSAAQPLSEDSPASGVEWLCHPKAMQTYLSLLSMSKKDHTLEACCGALQNLTASKEAGASAMSQILVQKMGALMHMPPLLKSSNLSLKKAAVSMLSNMSRTSSVQSTMAKQILPELMSLLKDGPREMGNSDETVASVCNTVQTLMLSNTDVSKKVINNELVSVLADLSENRSFPKSCRAASLLLYSLWNEKNLQGVFKKLGFPKSTFVNDFTTAMQKSGKQVE
ncbi:Plakophilin-1 Band-6 protein [Channa argus]|uniref:Plakophilin-1 Band-6 protein n=1 Tax=Channa argus TaxID=215402 RepID=A0A6G1Q335_CHAAH|nr:Plakophilin-1 Band-6 protein [Channa argus]KAK2897594.1 hypothetical protein Q8A73_013974 [Channa argus]